MSNKSRSQRSSTASVPEENRRSRRKEKEKANAVAGPSSPTPKPADVQMDTRKNENNMRTENAFGEADFIAFTLSDPEEDASNREPSPPTREWDKGKGKARANGRESENAGRKRKADELDLNDGYANKKERVAAASRKAPWTKDVDWDSCANVAEMYAVLNLHTRRSTDSQHTCQDAQGCRSLREVHITDAGRRRSPLTYRATHFERNREELSRCTSAAIW